MKKVKRLFFLVVSFLFFFSVSILAVVTDNSENLIIPAGESYTLDGTHSYSNSVQIYGTLYVTSYNGTGTTGKLELIAPTVIISSGGRIDVSGYGYLGSSGPGAGQGVWSLGGGGGYGGLGGNGREGLLGGIAYGSLIEPQDFGSGGGGSQGGSGGGVIRITVNGLLEVNGAIVSNGARGGPRGGGGSGGSIYITAGTFSGIGNISANGEGSGGWDSGGGSGGRIAIYYTTSLFTGKLEAKGGTGYQKGGDGTITFQPLTTESPISVTNLSETFSQDTSLSETLVTQKVTLSNLSASGDLNGTVSFTNFEIISIKSGSFANKGFFRSNWTASLEGAQYKGYWEGISYFIPGERKIYLKGTIEGQIYGVVEGYLAESVSGSNIYDLYNATWSFNQVGNQLVSGKTNLSGTLTYQETIEYPSTQIYFLQTSIEGTASGHYTGPLNTVLTHLRIKDTNNPYNGEGFSIISYISEYGSGQGWTYAKTISEKLVEMSGLFEKPLFGLVSATLDESKTPKTLSITTTRLDIGLPPEPDLKVRIWGPDRASPGQTVSYIVGLRNDGLKADENCTVIVDLPGKVDFVSGSTGAKYSYPFHTVRWVLTQVPAKTVTTFNFQIKIHWGLPVGAQIVPVVDIVNTIENEEFYSEMEGQWSPY